jgi:hypothetical protein
MKGGKLLATILRQLGTWRKEFSEPLGRTGLRSGEIAKPVMVSTCFWYRAWHLHLSSSLILGQMTSGGQMANPIHKFFLASIRLWPFLIWGVCPFPATVSSYNCKFYSQKIELTSHLLNFKLTDEVGTLDYKNLSKVTQSINWKYQNYWGKLHTMKCRNLKCMLGQFDKLVHPHNPHLHLWPGSRILPLAASAKLWKA